MTQFTIEPGKTYQTRNGWTAEVMFEITAVTSQFIAKVTRHDGLIECIVYHPNGRYMQAGEYPFDILPPRSPSWWVNVYSFAGWLSMVHESRELANQNVPSRRTHLLELGLTPDGDVEIRGQEKFG